MEENYLSRARYSASVTNWIRSSLEYQPAIAATLTFRKAPAGFVLTESSGDKCIKEFAKRLNRKAFGQRAKPKRGGKELNFVPVREGGGNTRTPLHYHAVIGVPDGFNIAEWADMCAEAWVGLSVASKRHNTFYEVRDDGWFEYMTKQRTKNDPLDYLVVEALQLNDRPIVLH